MKKKILIFGSSGMLGSGFVELLKFDYQLILPSQKQCDIAKPLQVNKWVKRGISLVINCAAITNIDYCERNPKEALLVNFLGSVNILNACKKNNIEIMHFGSTHDRELINVYALTKHLSCQIFRTGKYKKFYVFRTDLLFGGGRQKDKNFVGFILQMLKLGQKIGLTNDRYSSPTYTKDLVKFCWQCYKKKKYGIYEVGNQGRLTRWQLANEISKISKQKHKFYINNNFTESASRIKDSSVKTKYLRPYQEALREYIHESYL